MQELQCPLPANSKAVRCRRSNAHCPRQVAVYCRTGTSQCPRVVRQCIAGVEPPNAPMQYDSPSQKSRSLGTYRLLGRTPRPPRRWACALQEFPRPPPPGGVAVHCRSSYAHGPPALWSCICALQEFRCPMPLGSKAMYREVERPLPPRQCVAGVRLPVPPGSVAVHCRRSSARYRQEMWQ